MKQIAIPYIFFFLTLSTYGVWVKSTYCMSNVTLSDCEGFLLDSELGDLPGSYDHNEIYTLSIPLDKYGVAKSASFEITLESNTLCFEQSATNSGNAYRGSLNGSLSMTWENGLGASQSHYLTPTATTNYKVTANRECSDFESGVKFTIATNSDHPEKEDDYTSNWNTNLSERIDNLIGCSITQEFDQPIYPLVRLNFGNSPKTNNTSILNQKWNPLA